MSAIPLVTISQEGEFEVHPEAIELLEKCSTPIAIVAIAGLYRTGKSFLMNVLTENAGGFQVGSTVNACTKGIWIWSIPKYDPEKNMHIYFMDTEGLGSTNRSSTHDSRIFALALLLSSFFVYNSRGVIDGQAIEDLSLVANLTKVIHVKSSSGQREGDDGSALSQFFPSFLWVVRDFTLKLVDEQGSKISSLTYLENCLKPQSGFSESIASKNQIRQLICSFFRERDCLTMVRPAEDEEVLRNLSAQDLTSLRPEFQRQVSVFTGKVFNGLRPKQMMGKTLNGEMLATLLKSYIQSLNTGGVPVISSAWERVVASQCQEAKDAAMKCYEAGLEAALSERTNRLPLLVSPAGGSGSKPPPPPPPPGRPPTVQSSASQASSRDYLPLSDRELNAVHNTAKSAAKALYWSKLSDKNDTTAREFAKSLKEDFRSRLTVLREENRARSEVASNRFISAKLKDLSLSSRATVTSFQTVPSEPDGHGAGSMDISSITSTFDNFESCIRHIEEVSLRTMTAEVGDDDISSSSGAYVGTAGVGAFNKAVGEQVYSELLAWASSVAETFRACGEHRQTEFDSVNRGLAEINGSLATKRSVLEQLAKTTKWTESGLNERISSEKEKHDTDVRRKDAEASRYEHMIDDLMRMHGESMQQMAERQTALRARLDEEKKSIIEEERRLHGETFALMNETGSASSSRSQEAAKIEADVAAQEARIVDLKGQLEKIDVENERNVETATVKNNLALNKEKAAQKRTVENEKAAMDAEDRKEEESRKQTVRDLQEKINARNRQLQGSKDKTQVKFSNPAFNAGAATIESEGSNTSVTNNDAEYDEKELTGSSVATPGGTEQKKKKRFLGGLKKLFRSEKS